MKRIFPALLAATAAAVIALAAGLASAADVRLMMPSFKTAQAADTPIVVDIAASWCRTCAAQKPIIESLVNGGGRLVRGSRAI